MTYSQISYCKHYSLLLFRREYLARDVFLTYDVLIDKLNKCPGLLKDLEALSAKYHYACRNSAVFFTFFETSSDAECVAFLKDFEAEEPVLEKYIIELNRLLLIYAD